MSLTVIVVILVIILMMGGAAPVHNWSAGWGYGPSGILGIVLVIVVLMLLFGQIG